MLHKTNNILFGIFFAAALTANAADSKPGSVEERVIQRGPHHRVVEFSVPKTNDDGTVSTRSGRYTELATGMNRKEGNAYIPADVRVVGARGGAQARMGRLQASFAASINSSGSVEVRGAENEKVRMHLLGLAYDDGKARKFFARLRDSRGKIVGESQVIYENALDGVEADVIYSCSLSGIEQDVVLKSQPPSPQSLGLSDSAELIVVTEIVDSPEPERREQPFPGHRFNDRTVYDERISFGTLHFGPSKAFQSDKTTEEHPARKRWSLENGRSFLIEAIDWKSVAAELGSLHRRNGNNIASATLPAPPPGRSEGSMEVASAISRAGFVLDYQLLDSMANFTFARGVTYRVTGQVVLAGNTVIQGGSVVKFDKYKYPGPPSLIVLGNITTDTSELAPAVFTAVDDNLSGEEIPGSSGDPLASFPTGGYASPCLRIVAPSSHLRFLRFLYGGGGIVYSGGTHVLDHSMLEYCRTTFVVDGCTLNLRNVLMFYSLNMFLGTAVPAQVNGQHVTISGSSSLIGASPLMVLPHKLVLTNSIVSGVDFMGNGYDSVNSVSVSLGGTYPVNFTQYGGGYHYINPSSGNLNAGVTTIDPDLLQEIRQMSTTGPTVHQNSLFTASSTLSTKAPVDNDAFPDRGFHYIRLDYLFRDSTNQTTLVLSNGVRVVFFGNSGLKMDTGSKLVLRGTASESASVFRTPLVHDVWPGNETLNRVAGDLFRTLGTGIEVDCSFASFPSLVPEQIFPMTSGIKVTMKNSAALGGAMVLNEGNGEFVFLNNVFEAVKVEGRDSTKLEFYNNGFFAGSFDTFAYSSRTTANLWDNLLDGVSFSGGTYYDLRNNGVTRMASIGGNTQISTNLQYQSGPFGRYYQLNSPWINVGSRLASDAGLFHFTVQNIANVREGNTQVDIGPHFASSDANGKEPDLDGDGIPDYLEDLNGNGLSDSGETNYGGPPGNISNALNLLEVFTPLD